MTKRALSLFTLLAILLVMIAAQSHAAALRIEARKGNLHEVRRQVAAGGDIERAGVGGAGPLYHASLKGRTDVVLFLLESGANVQATNDSGVTALHVASGGGHLDVMRLLAKFGADLDATLSTEEDASDSKPDASKSKRSRRPSTPLATAAQVGNIEAVKLLIELGATLPAPDAIKEASRRGHSEIATHITKATAQHKKETKTAAASDSSNDSPEKPPAPAKPTEVESD